MKKYSTLYKQQSIDKLIIIQEIVTSQTMEIEKQGKKNGKRLRPEEEEKSKETGVKKDLLRLERDIFELKKAEEGDSEYVIRKLMAKKQKPQIGIIQQSPLLSRLKQLMPVFHKSNEQLLQRPIQQSEKIDVQLQQCESSSSSSDSEDDENLDNQEKQEQLKEKVRSKIQDMDIEQTNNSSSQSEMLNEAEQSEVNQVEINFLRYPYLNEEMLAQLEKEKLHKPKQQEKKQQKQKKKVLIEQIPEHK